MAKILSKERVVEYSVNFKIGVVALTNKLDIEAAQIASVLGLHPVMVYRWCQECREGKLIAKPTRRISMTVEPPDKRQTPQEKSEIKRLQREVAELRKENDFPKKWDRYLKDQKLPGSDS